MRRLRVSRDDERLVAVVRSIRAVSPDMRLRYVRAALIVLGETVAVKNLDPSVRMKMVQDGDGR